MNGMLQTSSSIHVAIPLHYTSQRLNICSCGYKPKVKKHLYQINWDASSIKDKDFHLLTIDTNLVFNEMQDEWHATNSIINPCCYSTPLYLLKVEHWRPRVEDHGQEASRASPASSSSKSMLERRPHPNAPIWILIFFHIPWIRVHSLCALPPQSPSWDLPWSSPAETPTTEPNTSLWSPVGDA